MDDTEPDGSQWKFADKNAPEKFGHADRGADDGYKYTSYPANGYGLTCQVTNVWEWWRYYLLAPMNPIWIIGPASLCVINNVATQYRQNHW
jgi:hypothetical protein